MTPDERQTPRFEPPPWEAEAFERFRSEQERVRAATELEDALRQVKAQVKEPPQVVPVEAIATGEPAQAQGTTGAPAASPPDTPDDSTQRGGPVPEARIDAMLAELKAQETHNPQASQTLVYGSAAFLATLGVFLVVFAITMYSRTNPSGGSAMVLAAMTSLIMLLAGAGCIAGAVVLYRKHHQ
ncbi:MAG: hypothetical protein VB139_03805 [Coriobacteriia bacterium]|nr:hypothetical protein [Coriobacteriia bacterium]